MSTQEVNRSRHERCRRCPRPLDTQKEQAFVRVVTTLGEERFYHVDCLPEAFRPSIRPAPLRAA
jgi:hypothetical protein